MKSCFFIGHRNAPETLLPLLASAVERHITEYGVDDFVVGHYGRFDALAAFLSGSAPSLAGRWLSLRR